MSYTVATPGGKARPATVTAASSLLLLGAAFEVITLVLSILVVSRSLSVLTDEFANSPNAGTARTFVIAGAVFWGVVPALFATGMVVLGLLLRKGKNAARIVTWVLAGIAVLCYGCILGGNALTSSISGMGGTPTPHTQAMQNRLKDAIPAWQSVASTTATVIVMLALVSVIILLAMPASSDFFRKEQEVWVPPTWPGDGTGGLPPAQPGPPTIPGPSAPQAPMPPGAPPLAPGPASMPPSDPPATPQG
jgi:hypothetical protein